MNWFRFTRGKRRSVAKRTRANDQRVKTYRPRLDALEERLPPGDTVLGGLLARWWAGSASGPFIAQADSLLAPEGRPSIAKAVRRSLLETGWALTKEVSAASPNTEGENLSANQR